MLHVLFKALGILHHIEELLTVCPEHIKGGHIFSTEEW